jgi:hypothetical protein
MLYVRLMSDRRPNLNPKMTLQLLFILPFILSSLAQLVPWTHGTKGKPEKMLEVGRLPALGCTPPMLLN